MRVLLTANASYDPPRGGATRSNLVWLDRLGRAGHECRIVSGAPGEGAKFAAHPRVEIIAVADPALRVERLRREIRDWRPDWVLVSSEDVGHSLLREAHRSAPGRIVYLAHTPQFFPFGPESWNRDGAAAELVRRSAGIVAIGQHMADYVRRESGREVAVIHPPIYGRGRDLRQTASRPDGLSHRAIVMLNPCAVKGISIFLACAERFPQLQFAALPGWGTTAEDQAALSRFSNVQLLANAPDIDDIFAQTGILLMPSLWYEGFGLIAMEAMLRGIPVVASDSGGLKEAKRGTNYIIPVHTIERYETVFDEHSMPKPVLPHNDVEPWIAALVELACGDEAYDRESTLSQGTAERFVDSIDPDAFEKFLAGLRPRLRILLAQNAVYHPAHGGGEISNRLLMEALAVRGHECRVVARGANDLELRGVKVRAAPDNQLRTAFIAEAAELQPDVIVCSTDDPAHLLFEPSLATGARVVYLVRATLALPFGPDCAFPSEAQTARLRRVASIVGVSQYVADYVRRHAGIEAVHVPISLMPHETWPDLGRFENEFVLMINPCAVKGIAILLALADRFPDLKFAAVPTWGTDAAERADLEARPNVSLFDPVDDIDELFRRTRVLLVPSLWAEARSRIVVEATLRGIPVIASNTGGLPEAKMGVPYVLPVNAITRYQPRLNERMAPIAEVPAQDIGCWVETLYRLTTDREHYEEIARQSRDKARAYAKELSVEGFEGVLLNCAASPPAGSRAQAAAHSDTGIVDKELSPEKRALLALRLRQRAPASAWFGGDAKGLLYFPAAGEVAAQISSSRVGCPIILPGRGSRAAEAPFDRIAPLVQSLADALQRCVKEPFAFFGHSLGAIVAFELARELRRRSLPLPRALIVSAARAPQFRRNHVPPPEPSDEELLHEAGLPDDLALRRSILPALRADTRLYRNYVYTEEEPLAIPVRAYGGLDDPHVSLAHLEAWSEQTTRSFAVRRFPGGHFYLKDHAADIARVIFELAEMADATT